MLEKRECLVCGGVVPQPESVSALAVANYRRQRYCGAACKRRAYRRSRKAREGAVEASVDLTPTAVPGAPPVAREAILETLTEAFEMHPDFRSILLMPGCRLGAFDNPSAGFFSELPKTPT